MTNVEIWGTCAVNDHARPEAFLRELLLFDRLVIPYPDSDDERDRWRRPNPANPNESWDPDRLDELLDIIGADERSGRGDRPLAVTTLWSRERWEDLGGRQIAEAVNDIDAPFLVTREIIRSAVEIPDIVEALPIYPSPRVWRQCERPERTPPADLTAATALITLARPLLLPNAEGRSERDLLLEVVELACDPEFIAARRAYHDWLRDMVVLLRQPGQHLDDVSINEASLSEMTDRLRDLMEHERTIVAAAGRKDHWTRMESAATVGGASASLGAPLMAGSPIAAILVAGTVTVFGLAGWWARKRGQVAPEATLSGASVFVRAQDQMA